jgi:hypothetical protein
MCGNQGMAKRRRTPEDRYKYHTQKQDKALGEFASHEIEWAGDLIHWYGLVKKEMPHDEYRACAFFINKEYLRKPGSLTLLYAAFRKLIKEMPPVTKEIAFDLLAYRYKVYAEVLANGRFN